MAIQLGEVIKNCRLTNAAFTQDVAPKNVLANALTDYQRELAQKATRQYGEFLVQSLPLVLDMNIAEAPGTAGAATTGGLPAVVDASGGVSADNDYAGALVTFSWGQASVILDLTAVVSVAGNQLTLQGVTLVTGAMVGKFLSVVYGPGSGAIYQIKANDTVSVTIADKPSGALGTFSTTPTTATVVQILQVIGADPTSVPTMGIVTGLPSLGQTQGYMVKSNAQGLPYIDFTDPKTVRFDVGITLPEFHIVLGGTVRYAGGGIFGPISDPTSAPFFPTRFPSGDFKLVSYNERLFPPYFPSGYLLGGELFFCGQSSDWSGVAGIDLRYVPIPPAVNVDTDFFLVPEIARASLNAYAALTCAVRAAQKGHKVDVKFYDAKAGEAEQTFLQSITHRSASILRTTRRNR